MGLSITPTKSDSLFAEGSTAATKFLPQNSFPFFTFLLPWGSLGFPLARQIYIYMCAFLGFPYICLYIYLLSLGFPLARHIYIYTYICWGPNSSQGFIGPGSRPSAG